MIHLGSVWYREVDHGRKMLTLADDSSNKHMHDDTIAESIWPSKAHL